MRNHIDKIEEILYEKALEMKTPTILGDVGVLFFEATYYKYTKKDIHKKKSLSLLEKLLSAIPERELPSGFLEGFEGMFWVVLYLKECKIIEDDHLIDDLLPYLFQSLRVDIAHNNFDVLHGSVNKLYYLIKSNKNKRKEIYELVNSFIDSLYKNRQETSDGIFWFDDVEEGENYVNLGLAHGIPSVLIFLTKLKDLGFTHSKIDILIEGIIKSLLSFQNKEKSDSYYADIYSENNKEKYVSSRLAYCYGDLGIAYAFMYSGKILKKESLIEEAKKILYRIINRGIGHSKIDHFEEYYFFETGFCHGLSGITYMLIKINELLNSPVLEKRITYWKNQLNYNLTTQLSIKEDIYYPSYRQDEPNSFILEERCILTGLTGTGLVLLSLEYEKYDWSDFFLLY